MYPNALFFTCENGPVAARGEGGAKKWLSPHMSRHLLVLEGQCHAADERSNRGAKRES